MGARPSIIEANHNLSKYVGEFVDVCEKDGYVYLNIGCGPRAVIFGYANRSYINDISGIEITGLDISSQIIHTPGKFYGVYEQVIYTLTVRLLGLQDLLITSHTGFTLQEKIIVIPPRSGCIDVATEIISDDIGETLFESRIGS